MWILIAAEAMASAPSLKVRHREQPTYPLVSPPPPIDLRCLVTVSIQVDGRAKKAVVDDPCPEPFAEATRQAAMGYRWKPVRVDGKRVTAQTKIAMIFQWDEPPLPEAPAVDGFALPEYRRRGELGSGGGDAAPWPSTGPYEPVAYAGPLGEHHGMWTPRSAEPGPAVVWLGGRRYGEDQDVPAPFHEAGVVTMIPGLRGGPGNPGTPECGLGEVDDVLSAIRWLGAQPGIDPQRIYVAGHDSGATLALLVAESTAEIRGVVAVGPEVDPVGDGCPVRRADSEPAWAARTPLPWIGDVAVPTWIIAGRRDPNRVYASQLLLQRRGDAPVSWLLPGDVSHFTVVGPALRAAATAIVADTGASPALQVVWPDL
jgi:hypothetical protein